MAVGQTQNNLVDIPGRPSYVGGGLQVSTHRYCSLQALPRAEEASATVSHPLWRCGKKVLDEVSRRGFFFV